VVALIKAQPSSICRSVFDIEYSNAMIIILERTSFPTMHQSYLELHYKIQRRRERLLRLSTHVAASLAISRRRVSLGLRLGAATWRIAVRTHVSLMVTTRRARAPSRLGRALGRRLVFGFSPRNLALLCSVLPE